MKPTKSATTIERTSVGETVGFVALITGAVAGAGAGVELWLWVESSLTRRDVMDFSGVVYAKGDFRKKKMKCE
jgi:hypothetical protein